MGERRPAGAAPIKDHATPLGRSYWRDCALLANDLRGIGRTAVSVGPVGYAWMLIYTAALRVNARFCRRQGSAGSGLLRRCSRPAAHIDGSQGQRRDTYHGRSDCGPGFRVA